jgi:hypothetical protein
MKITKKALAVVAAVGLASVGAFAVYKNHELDQTCTAYETEMFANRQEFLSLNSVSKSLLSSVFSFMQFQDKIAENQARMDQIGERTRVLVPSYTSVCGEKRSKAWYAANKETLQFL